MAYISLNFENIQNEHICCAFSDKKCSESYAQKKEWLKREFRNDYIFFKLNERAKVFIEYGPAENSWMPVTAPECLMLGCFWVSGQYKGQGHGKALLKLAIEEAKKNKKRGITAVVGTKKFHFMSDARWLIDQGFKVVDTTPAGFSLLLFPTGDFDHSPRFNDSTRSGECPHKKGLVAYYSNRCPYSDYHVTSSLVETAKKRNMPLKIIKFETRSQAQSSPTPATIFSLFNDGKFITTDLSVCMDSRFDKVVQSRNA